MGDSRSAFLMVKEVGPSPMIDLEKRIRRKRKKNVKKKNIKKKNF